MTDLLIGAPASPGYSTNPPDTSSANMNPDVLRSPAPPVTASTASSIKVYVLMYSVTMCHPNETDDEGPHEVDDEADDGITRRGEPCGVVGVFLSEAQAKRVGKKWLYDHFRSLRVVVGFPLPIQDESEWTEPVWKRSGWRHTAGGSWVYSISAPLQEWHDLVVLVTEKRIQGNDEPDVQEYRDSDDDEADDQDDGGMEPEGQDASGGEGTGGEIEEENAGGEGEIQDADEM